MATKNGTRIQPRIKFSGCYQNDSGAIVITFNPPGLGWTLTREQVEKVIAWNGTLGIPDINLSKLEMVYGLGIEPMVAV
jgi:hypothetical protein